MVWGALDGIRGSMTLACSFLNSIRKIDASGRGSIRAIVENGAATLGKWKGRWPFDGYAQDSEGRSGVLPAAKDLGRFLDELATWNAKLDLTAAKGPEELCDLMLGDACALAKVLPQGATVIDVGTGAGGPAISLALLRPDLVLTLVEPLAKRTAFLRTALAAVGRADVRVVRGRGEDLLTAGERWDVAMSRATLAPPAWLSLGADLVRPGGTVAVLLAKEAAPDTANATRGNTVHYTLAYSGASRTLALYTRV